MPSYKTENNQDLFYVVNKTVGDLNGIYSFLVDNPTFKINFVPTYADANYTKAKVIPPAVVSNKPSSEITSKEFKSDQNQTIFDICLMTLTDLNQIYSFGINLNEIPKAQSTFTYNPQNIIDQILSKSGLVFNTGQRVTPADQNIYFLLQENGYYILQENLGKIILE